jgi:DNA-3-methyladenine glycosylase I
MLYVKEKIMEEILRCPWVPLSKPDYVEYHDKEWGVPVYEDTRIFEFLTLEAAQAGLSWYIVLKKRENYRKAFDGFDPEKIAKYNDKKIEELLNNQGIIRNKAKICAAINNAKKFLEIKEKYGNFAKYIWQFVDGKPIINNLKKLTDYKATSKESDALSKDLVSLGFKFMGSTVCYAHMQATGMVIDHTLDCFRRRKIIDKIRLDFNLCK